MSEFKVKVADHAVARGDHVIVTIGLGSCVAIMLYDAREKVGALAHVLLPSSAMSRDQTNRAKFPGTAVPMMLAEMRDAGARGPITAKIVGGASMFASLLPSGGINMGERNIAATREALATANVPLIALDTGGDYGRSVYLHLSDGRVVVKSLKKGELVL